MCVLNSSLRGVVLGEAEEESELCIWARAAPLGRKGALPGDPMTVLRLPQTWRHQETAGLGVGLGG